MSHLKIEAARRQLGTSLALYLQDHDPVSVHCLAGGGCEVIEFYAKKAGHEPFTSHILKGQPKLDIKELRRRQRRFWTAFKHAVHQHSGNERDDDRLLLDFIDEHNDVVLVIGWYDYALVTNTMPIEAQVQQAWYLAIHPEKLHPDLQMTQDEIFPNIRSKSRAEQKRMLNLAIERARANKEIMADPGTDTRALVLAWPSNE